jgi:very-short-patch-repair endonuclease
MSVVEMLRELGGVARTGTLLRAVSRGDLERAVAAGDVVRDARGRYALPDADRARRVAARLGGVLALTSAAQVHGWAVKHVPVRAHVTVSRSRKVGDASDAHVHFAELSAAESLDGVTSAEVTLAQCLRLLPFDEALAVADSALREGLDPGILRAVGDSARGPGSRQMVRVSGEASPLADNPFESVLRAIALDVPGLAVRPQVTIREPGLVARPDLVDEGLRIVLEADSFEWHGGRSALSRDARRYNLLTVHGWIVLRFAWEQVMHEADYVSQVLVDAVALAELMNERPGRPGSAA